MGRQPFRNFQNAVKGGQITIGATTIGSRPALERLAGDCVIAWPNVEAEMCLALALLLGTDKRSTIAVFHTLRRFTNQQLTILTAAEHTLPKDECQLLSALLDVHKSVESERNAIAHGHFGVHNKMDDALIWISMEDYVQFKTDVYLANIVVDDKTINSLKECIYVYKEKDLKKIFEEIISLSRTWVSAINWLKARQPLRDTLFQQLSSQSRVAAALTILRQKNNREAQSQSPPLTDGAGI